MRHSRPWLVGKYARSISVENLDYTTILEVRSEDEIALRAKLFLDTLSQEYKEFNLRSEYEINDKTLAYIDKQLDEVTEILNRYEDDLQHYMEDNAILDLNKEQSRYYSEMVVYDNKKRGYELQIASLDDPEDYVLNLDESEKLLPPSAYVLQDDASWRRPCPLYSMQMERNKDLFDAKEYNPVVQRNDSTLKLVRCNLLVYIKNTRKAFQGRSSRWRSRSRIMRA
ncbi:MAG: hypothetical protein IPN85_13245 [Flavobacteriales bacterium]|nr:hypothetical protein [Flavobacteriales bacterium]